MSEKRYDESGHTAESRKREITYTDAQRVKQNGEESDWGDLAGRSSAHADINGNTIIGKPLDSDVIGEHSTATEYAEKCPACGTKTDTLVDPGIRRAFLGYGFLSNERFHNMPNMTIDGKNWIEWEYALHTVPVANHAENLWIADRTDAALMRAMTLLDPPHAYLLMLNASWDREQGEMIQHTNKYDWMAEKYTQFFSRWNLTIKPGSIAESLDPFGRRSLRNAAAERDVLVHLCDNDYWKLRETIPTAVYFNRPCPCQWPHYVWDEKVDFGFIVVVDIRGTDDPPGSWGKGSTWRKRMIHVRRCLVELLAANPELPSTGYGISKDQLCSCGEIRPTVPWLDWTTLRPPVP